MTFKQKVHEHLLKIVGDKVSMLESKLKELRNAAANETKSTAGDKHETALAMIQIEQANTKDLLEKARIQAYGIQKLNPVLYNDSITEGSLVETSFGAFFFSVSLGKIEVEGKIVTAISPASPLGASLMGKKSGDILLFNQKQITVKSIE